MIQAVRETQFKAWLSLEDSRIDTSVALTQVRHLFKFINDMDKAVFYAYPSVEVATERCTACTFLYNATPDVYTGKTKLIPAGYYKYEVYEVTWEGTVTISTGNAPVTEDDVLTPPAATKGIVQGLMGIGKLYLAEKAGDEQVQYNQHPEPRETNYIYYGQ